MCSSLPKPLVPLMGRPLVCWLLDALQRAGVDESVIVVGHGAQIVRETLGKGYRYALQEPRLGMAHAVEVAREALGEADPILVTVGDSPLLSPATLQRLIETHRARRASCTFLTGLFPGPLPYARVLRDSSGKLLRCVEERDATAEERQCLELLSSHYLFQASALWSNLGEIQPHPRTGERYLTDVIDLLLLKGLRVEALRVEDPDELVGLNSPQDLAWAQALMERRRANPDQEPSR